MAFDFSRFAAAGPPNPGYGGVLGMGNGGGVLGGSAGSFQDFMNSDAPLTAAAALIGGPTLRQGLSNAFAASAPAMIASKKRMAINDWLKAGAPKDIQHPATIALFNAAPELAQGMVGAAFTPHREFTQIGASVMGQPQYGFVDPVAGTVNPIGGQDGQGAGGAPAQGGGAPGGGLYGNLPKPQQAQVDAIVEGRMAFPSGYQLSKSPYWNSIVAAAEERAQALGTPLDANKYPTRLATNKDFTSGKAAQTITAGNAAIGHLGLLDQAVDKLGNWNGIPLVNYYANAARNAVKGASGAATDLQSFDAIKKRYTDEISKFYAGAGGSAVGDREEAMRQLDSARSPAELHATIQAQVHLLHSKIEALQEQWHNGMGANEPDFPLIKSSAQAVIDRLAPPQAAQQGGAPQQGGELPMVASPEEAMQLPPGTQFKTPDGRIKMVPAR